MAKSKKIEKIKIRASSTGKLMTGSQGITDNQKAILAKHEERKEKAKTGAAKPLTAKMEEERLKLIAKRDAPFELSKTAKSMLKEKWMYDKYGFRKVVITKELQKGNLCEQDAMGLLDEVLPMQQLRVKSQIRYENDFLVGNPDVTLFGDGIGEDTKCSWDLHTYLNVERPDLDYIAQGQSYMELTGLREFAVCYCLVTTPTILLKGDFKSLFYKYNVIPVHGILDEENDLIIDPYKGNVPSDLIKDLQQVLKNHQYDQIPPQARIKRFEFNYCPDFIKELKFRCEAANDFYHSLKVEEVLDSYKIPSVL